MVLSEEDDVGRPARFECYKCAARAVVQVARVGAEKNHVCIYISAGINHSTEKSQHKTQTGSRARDSTSVEYAMADVLVYYPLTEKCFYYSR